MNTRTAESYNTLTSEIISAAIEVHRRLGPGLLESAYEACLVYELQKRGRRALSQVGLPVIYDEVKLDIGYRIDILVEDAVIIELKAVEKVIPLHEAQLILPETERQEGRPAAELQCHPPQRRHHKTG